MYTSSTRRMGNCKQCKSRHETASKYSWLVELKFNWWLYWHYKKEHKTDILLKTIFRLK